MLYLDFLEKGVNRYPDHEVVREGETSLTYRQLSALVDRIASALIHAGLEPGSHVGIYAPNHIYGFAAQYGILRAGCIWAPVSFRVTGVSGVETLAALDLDWIFFHTSLSDEVRTLKQALPGLKGAVCFDGPSELGPDFTNWLAQAPRVTAFPRRTPADTAAFLCTSGTTGKSKGIVLSNHAFSSMIAGFDAVLTHAGRPVHLIVAPLSHAAGIYGSCLFTHGGINILLQKSDPLSILQAIERHRVTTMFLPPTLVYMLLGHPDVRKFDYSSLQSILYGAAPMAEHKLKEALDIFGPVLAQLYGQSEALMMCAFMSREDHVEALANPNLAHRLFAAGREGPMIRVEIMGDDGRLLPPGERGEIVLRGDILMDRYYKDPAATAEAQAGGWHHTGDIGYKDADGFIYIVDRKKELIITGGFNVFPREVEQVVMSHPSVQDCAVVGIPDEKWGEAVMAAVELRAGAVFDEQALIAHCKAQLGSVKAPKSIKVVETLPRSGVGKVLRREVRAPYWAGRTRLV